MTNIAKFLLLAGQRLRHGHGSQVQGLRRGQWIHPFRMLNHPLETLSDLKYERQGSVCIANLLAALFFLCRCAAYFLKGYLFNPNRPEDFSLPAVLAQSALLLFVFAVCNWSTCTLLEGEGSFREVWIATCYATVPVVLFEVPFLLLTNAFTLAEQAFFSAGTILLQGWMLLLLFLSVMVTHAFTVAKTVGSLLITVCLMLAAAFLVLLFFTFFQQMTGFAATVTTELLRR